MGRLRSLPPLVVAVAVTALASPALAAGPAVTGSVPQPASGGGSAGAVSAASGSLLWATVNVCDTEEHPNALGIRASMPGNGLRERMYMRFRAEYYNGATDAWAPANNAVSRWVYVGPARYRYRQGGWTFTFAQPPAGKTYTIRGMVDFQWRARKRRHRRHRSRAHKRRHHRHHRRAHKRGHHRHHRRAHKRRHHRHRRRSHKARWIVARRKTRVTRSGVQAVAGGDPAGISKAYCLIY